MFSQRARLSNSVEPRPTHYNSEYVAPTPWYDFFWHPYGRITRQKFNKLQIGMTRQEVTDIIGGPGRVIEERNFLRIHTVTVVYKGRFWSPTPTRLTFRNGLLDSKSRR
jgi:hypothetical protein